MFSFITTSLNSTQLDVFETRGIFGNYNKLNKLELLSERSLIPALLKESKSFVNSFIVLNAKSSNNRLLFKLQLVNTCAQPDLRKT